MREYKFRGWDNDIEKMFYENFYLSLKGDLHQGDDLDYKNKRRFEIMQYTGLKDKNGKEIFEGDILREVITEGEIITKVVFHNHSFKEELIKSPYNHLNCFFEFGKGHNYEVIGNIFENSELLKS